MKKLICLIFSLVLVFSFSIQSFAARSYEAISSTSQFFWFGSYGGALIKSWSFDYNSDSDYHNLAISVSDSEFSMIQSQFLGMGCQFDYGLGFEKYASYQFTLSFVVSAANSLDVSDPSLFNCMGTHTESPYWYPNISEAMYLSTDQNIVYEDGVYTFTAKSIAWDDFSYYPYVYMAFPGSCLSSSGSSLNIVMLNTYFGLESAFDEEIYNNAMAEKLDNIQSSLDENNDKLDELIEQDKQQHEENKGFFQKIIEGITSIPQKIKDAFKNLIDEVIGSVTDSISSAMDDFLSNLTDKLGILYQAPDYFVRIIEAIITTEASNELTFPSMVVPVAGKEYILNEPMPFQIFPDWIPEEVYTFLNMAMSITVIIAVINYADKKWEDITTNG